MMDNQSERLRKWKNLLKNYRADHEYLNKVGKSWILSEGRSTETERKIKEALIHTDKSLNAIKEYFEPYLETMQKEIEHLRVTNESGNELIHQNERLNYENVQLKQKLDGLEAIRKDNFQSIMERKQEQFDETFKIQNDLIGNLREQLEQNAKEMQTLRQLNTNLKSTMDERALIQTQECLLPEASNIIGYPTLPLL
ncbi:hypothetical protein PPYR_12881 [Photinus pyralis]|uniref:Uncharacterized protein n=1 Tax=Photinus pyralis TaxID=7054 RepID=A0A5N4A7F8_PHOPY|nr:uncharacterized protein LOC116179479 [Photinus pyralis]XP_031359042.1 uncharacterized protein LOC116182640 [Photinus pyralis]KAB0793261.1 hypothetical protein PPYR_12881 [Photinus pyralis]